MAKISALPFADELAGDETMVVLQGGKTKQTSASQHIAHISGTAMAYAIMAQEIQASIVFNGPIYDSVEDGEAAVVLPGSVFHVIIDGEFETRRRTADGSDRIWSVTDMVGHRTLWPIDGEADFVPRFLAAIAKYDSVRPIGSFPIGQSFGAALVGKQIIGVPGVTKFIATTPAIAGEIINLGENSIIEGVEVRGMLPTVDPTLSSWFNTINGALALENLGTTNLVKLSGKGAIVENCLLVGASGFSVVTSKNNVGVAGQGVRSGVFNSRMLFNYGAIKIPEESEYLAFEGNWMCYNVVGYDKAGGNNNFTNNHIDHNRVAGIIRGGANNAHGSLTVGSANHSKFATLIIDSVTNGEIITGNSMFDGGPWGIYLRNSIGINIADNQLGRMAMFCVGNGAGIAPANPGTNIIHGNQFNLHGVNFKIWRNYNEATGLSDPTTPDNCVFYGNFHMEGDARRDASNWDPVILNDRLAPDSNGYRSGETIVGASVSRFLSGTPIDGVKHFGTGSMVGAIAINLPIPNFNNSFLSFDISVSCASSGRSARIAFAAYAISGSGGIWANATWLRIDGFQYKVRLGRTAAGRPVIYIGELDTAFSNCLVRIVEVTGHIGAYALARYWQRGWNVYQQATAFENVSLSSPDTGVSNGPKDYSGDLFTLRQDGEVWAIATANRPGGLNGMCRVSVRQMDSNIRTLQYHDTNNDLWINITYTGDAGFLGWKKVATVP